MVNGKWQMVNIKTKKGVLPIKETRREIFHFMKN
jgi:hypothetical protein